jgi:hypothetical protein
MKFRIGFTLFLALVLAALAFLFGNFNTASHAPAPDDSIHINP